MESCGCGLPGTEPHPCPIAMLRGEASKCPCCGDCEEECRKDAMVLADETDE